MKISGPDVVLMDMGQPGITGIEAIRMLQSMCPQAQFLVLTVYDDDRRILEAMCARACGLLRQVRPAETPEYGLTVQETRVLRLLGEGHHYKTAAADLGITVNTLSFHVRHIYDKLQVHSKSEAVAKAMRDGILR
jgi:DNA-binding NarL/FixJ family response regulator